MLRQAGVRRNDWFLASMQSLYITAAGPVVDQGTPLVTGTVDVAPFDQDAVIRALRADQGGESTFTEFCEAIWAAGTTSPTSSRIRP
ncbi:hypothetical protein [Polymorphospora lycopeni]|uniref:Uncharacterized protein n=1 Tax=Polymorphospora lycopeni TaxID=3140240 RepID=A0ABV5CW85_9ACTN